MAVVGHVDAISRAGIIGWAANSDDPATPLGIAVVINGVERALGRADQPRPGLAAATKGQASDQSGFRFVFEPPLSAFHAFRIEVVETATRQPLPSGVYVLPRPERDAAAATALAPLLITATGGAAVAQLIGDLARHPALVAADRPPYETRQIGYHAALFAALTAPLAAPTPRAPDTVLAPRPATGRNPLHVPIMYDLVKPRTLLQGYFERTVPAQYATTFRDLILGFYEILRLGQGKPAASWFVERGDLDDGARQAARLLFPRVKEVVLVRDPRDLLAAAIVAHKVPADAAMAALVGVVAQLAAIEAAADTLLLRHEDLILDPAGTRRSIGAFLGLDLGPPDTAAARPAGEAANSVGRWRTELSSEQRDACTSAFAAFLARFDYGGEAGGTAVAAPARPVRPSEPMLAAEGPQAVAALREQNSDTTADGRPMRPVARLEFGRGHVGAAQLGPGWSRPEDGHVWSNARQSHVALPAPHAPGVYRVWVTAAPLLIPDTIAAQTVTLLANGVELGTVTLRALSVIAFDLPEAVVAAGSKIALSFRLPDAARPKDVSDKDDDRLLGVSLRWITVFGAAPGPTGAVAA